MDLGTGLLAQNVGPKLLEYLVAINNTAIVSLGAHVDVFGKAFGDALGRKPGRHDSNP